MSLGRFAAACYWSAVLALALPLGLIVLTSLTDATLLGFPLGRPSLRWHAAALADPANVRAFLLSGALAAASATLAVAAAGRGAGAARNAWDRARHRAPHCRPGSGVGPGAARRAAWPRRARHALGGYEPTLPALIFGRLRSGLTPEINALATLPLLAAGAIGAALAWLTRARPAA